MRGKKEKIILNTIRISQIAKEKLSIIADRKATSLGDAASRIILHYATNNLDYEVSAGDALRTILQNQVGHQVTLVKVAGSVARTEDFIKSLLRRDDRAMPSERPESEVADLDDDSAVQAEDNRLSETLSILEIFFSAATDAFDFKGNPIMQIRLSKEDFLRYKSQYEKLCTSQTM
ncbi:hypothetical protein [Alistipes onderdonkii]|uniref:hypothetical protein n=1 Tax=Alistipes onderdonkii TaxID=328813 RepID=UPI00189BDE9B|nr:hypothetical protein [Alistipes onderdonkii]